MMVAKRGRVLQQEASIFDKPKPHQHQHCHDNLMKILLMPSLTCATREQMCHNESHLDVAKLVSICRAVNPTARATHNRVSACDGAFKAQQHCFRMALTDASANQRSISCFSLGSQGHASRHKEKGS